MILHPPGNVAVIFCAQRTADGEAEYQAAATEMSQLVAKQDGFLGEDHARSAGGIGITISYWRDDDSAKAWRDDPRHAAIREKGRDLWYAAYSLHVTRVERSYAWQK
jgi:heme-degrading monooxygenase HmoA